MIYYLLSKDMPVRKLIAILTKMNNSLTRFPEADEDDKFDTHELLEIIEWSLPYECRAKFDLDRYVPSHYDKARLIAEAEAIERSETILVKTKSNETKEKKSSKSRKEEKQIQRSEKVQQRNIFAPKMEPIKPMERLIVSPSKTEMVNNNQISQRPIGLFQTRSFERKSTS
jgi:hypothetical protein